MPNREPRNRVRYQSIEQAQAEDRVICERFEAQYDVPSSRLVDAFRRDDGTLEETDDFHSWDFAWARLKLREQYEG